MLIWTFLRWANFVSINNADQGNTTWTQLGGTDVFLDSYTVSPQPKNLVKILAGSKVLFNKAFVDLNGLPGVRVANSGYGALDITIGTNAFRLPCLSFGEWTPWGILSTPAVVTQDLKLNASPLIRIDSRNIQPAYTQAAQDLQLVVCLDVDLVRG